MPGRWWPASARVGECPSNGGSARRWSSVAGRRVEALIPRLATQGMGRTVTGTIGRSEQSRPALPGAGVDPLGVSIPPPWRLLTQQVV